MDESFLYLNGGFIGNRVTDQRGNAFLAYSVCGFS